MKIIAGLGNPGRRYVDTPHNAGFSVLDRLGERWECAWKSSLRFHARISKVRSRGEEILLIKPRTYMNQSGLSVGTAFRYFGCRLEDLMVVLDDADLPLGRLRIRAEGGTGGHRGLASVREHLGGDGFARLRVGIGRGSENLVEHVLAKWRDGDRPRVTACMEAGADAVETWIAEGVHAAMNRYNGPQIGQDGE